MSECVKDGCAKNRYIRGLCMRHYKLDLVSRAPKCSAGDCKGNAYAAGLCEIHYSRMRKHGSTERPAKNPNRRYSGNKNTGPNHNRFKHGLTQTPTYKVWVSMKRRCFSKNSRDYKNYGARGVTVCDRWLVFENFLADMGERPAKTTIDRIDNDGSYEPGNCRWADRVTQSRNRRYCHVTQEIADKIRADRKSGKTLEWISRTHGVSKSHALRIVNREAWA